MSASARSSVLIKVGQPCNPAVMPLQEFPTSEKYAGVRRLSSMRRQRLKGFDQARKLSRHFALTASQIAPKDRCVAHMISSLILLFGRASVRPFFEVRS